MQNKNQEIHFFSNYAQSGEYNVFSEESNQILIKRFLDFLPFQEGTVFDVGCGSGIFTHLLKEKEIKIIGLDLCFSMLSVGKKTKSHIALINGDAESLPLKSESLEAIFISALLHHLPDPSSCIKEIYRVLKPGGVFFAFDPNRKNPFMWLYRDKSSPFYSSKGVTLNERPILANELISSFEKEGFFASCDYVSLEYRYIASSFLLNLLPLYNFLEKIFFKPSFLKYFRSMVLTYGIKNRSSLIDNSPHVRN